MTDLLDAPTEEDFISPHEIVPVESKTDFTERPKNPDGKLVCPHCEKAVATSTSGLARHIGRMHKDKAPPPKTSKPKTKAISSVRRPLGETLARLFFQVGRVVNGVVDPPTGAAIMFESGALGNALDDLIDGTFIDKPLQKGAAVAEKFEPLMSLVMLPSLIYIVSHNESMGPMLETELRNALEDVMAQSLPLLKRQAARRQGVVDALKELKAIDPTLANSEDPVGDLLNSFFIRPAPVPEPEMGLDGEQ